MSQRDEFITFVNELKTTSPTISTEQYRSLHRHAETKYQLSVEEASKILRDSGLNVKRTDNYIEILGLSIEELQSRNEAAVVRRVEKAHNKYYSVSLKAGARPRPDGRTEEQWRTLLNQARDTLKSPQKREEYIENLQQEIEDPLFGGSLTPIFKFPNGDEALNIPQLARLMLRNSKDAIDALYRGYLEQSLGRAGEMRFADAARSVVRELPDNRELRLNAMVSILQEKMEFQEGPDARTPVQLANAIDLNWEQGKKRIFNGFIALWLEYAQHPELANIARNITQLYKNEQDIAVEKFVQRLNPRIGHPKLHISHEVINFGNIDTETREKIQLKIKNTGRGFLYGNLQLTKEIPGLELSTMDIRGNTLLTVKLNARRLASKRTYKTELVVNTNTGDPTAPASQYVIKAESEFPLNTNAGGLTGDITIPIACYVDYPVLKSIRRVAVSGVSIAAITFAVCLITLLLGDAGWLATRLTDTHFVDLNENWVEWSDKWLWKDWTIYKLGTPGVGFRFIIAFAALVAGVFAYRFFFFKRRGQP